MGEKSNDKQKIKLSKYGQLALIILVLCVLGLSMIVLDHPSVTMKDVAVNFSVAPTSVTVSDWNTASLTPYSYDATTFNYVVPINTYCTVSYTSPADLNSWASQTGSQGFTSYGGQILSVQPVSVCNSYTMQAALKT